MTDSYSILFKYTKVATDYNNCTCVNTTKTDSRILQSFSKVYSALPTLVNPGDIQPTSHYNSHDSQAKTGVLCSSFLVKNKLKQQRVCDVCCTKRSPCQLMNFKTIDLQRNELTPSSCWSLRLDLVTRANVCCHGALPIFGYKERLKNKVRFISDKAFKQKLDSFLDSFYNQFLKVLKPLHNDLKEEDDYEQMSGFQATKDVVESTIASAVSTNHVNNSTTIKDSGYLATQLNNSISDGCNQTGHVTHFHGASCHSNRSVNFFYMDSERFWSVAERFGVHGIQNKVCLVIVDVKVIILNNINNNHIKYLDYIFIW